MKPHFKLLVVGTVLAVSISFFAVDGHEAGASGSDQAMAETWGNTLKLLRQQATVARTTICYVGFWVLVFGHALLLSTHTHSRHSPTDGSDAARGSEGRED